MQRGGPGYKEAVNNVKLREFMLGSLHFLVKWEEMRLLEDRHNWRSAGFCIGNKCGKQGRELARDGKGMLSMSETLFSASFCPVALKDKYTVLSHAPLRVFTTECHGIASYGHACWEQHRWFRPNPPEVSALPRE